jgi:hypothetical protein
MGIKAGYVKKLASISPFINKIKLLCKPQPGQSKCVTDLNMQGSWWVSNQLMIFNKWNNIIDLSA